MHYPPFSAGENLGAAWLVALAQGLQQAADRVWAGHLPADWRSIWAHSCDSQQALGPFWLSAETSAPLHMGVSLGSLKAWQLASLTARGLRERVYQRALQTEGTVYLKPNLRSNIPSHPLYCVHLNQVTKASLCTRATNHTGTLSVGERIIRVIWGGPSEPRLGNGEGHGLACSCRWGVGVRASLGQWDQLGGGHPCGQGEALSSVAGSSWSERKEGLGHQAVPMPPDYACAPSRSRHHLQKLVMRCLLFEKTPMLSYYLLLSRLVHGLQWVETSFCREGFAGSLCCQETSGSCWAITSF